MPTLRPTTLAALAGLALLGGCERRGGCTGEYCGTMVIAATGEPDILLPPVSEFATTRDVTEPIFLKLADLGLSGNTVGDEDFQPQLAQRTGRTARRLLPPTSRSPTTCTRTRW
ncbi:MAG: hypothetical protein DMD67_01045 [Gemmatimonadetes bacterium]|nr:MAG: hypothetical protein DMD67_01045 [Gemmatimonadota bacterium]